MGACWPGKRLRHKHPNVRTLGAYSQPLDSDLAGEHFGIEGRLGGATIADAASGLDADYFLCRPAPLLGAMIDVLSGPGLAECV